MGMLESAVVVYLRELYYPEGFAFPLKMMSSTLILTEILREVATLIMLIAIGVLAGHTKTEKFGYFIYSFAIWDIFYYVFLKLLLNWPNSLLTWDILFLLPTTWVGSVIAPLLLSFAMIGLTLFIVAFTDKRSTTSIALPEWGLLIVGSIICIVSFTYEYSTYILKQFAVSEFFVPNEKLMEYAIQFVPEKFPWWIFILGFTLILSGIGRFIFKNKN
jgi:hypothetical protein